MQNNITSTGVYIDDYVGMRNDLETLVYELTHYVIPVITDEINHGIPNRARLCNAVIVSKTLIGKYTREHI